MEEPQLPSYHEALEWGVTPPPRPQWAPPSPRPNTARARTTALRPFSMSTIDEVLRSRPQTSVARRPPSLLDIGLNAVRVDSLNSASAARLATSPTRHSLQVPGRPAWEGLPAAGHFASHPSCRPRTPILEMPASPAYSIFPDALPRHIRPIVPPDYARHDPIARTFLLRTPVVYTTTGSSPQVAAFQLDSRLSKTGRPNQLAIRPLDHVESRTVSLSRDSLDNLPDYDDDRTLYLMQVMQLLGGFGVPGLGFGPSWRVEMQRDPKGDSAHNKGFIRFEGGGFLGTGTGFMQRSACKFYYMTRKTERHFGKEWRPEFEWNKRLMFSVERKRTRIGKSRGYLWKDGKGRLVGIESAEGRLDLTGVGTSMSARSREALLACWIGKAWAAGALTW